MKQLLCVLVAAVLVGSLVGCGNPAGSGENLIPGNSPNNGPEKDIASWFEGIYLDLLDRQEKGTMGQMVNCKYVCDAINAALKKTVVVVVPGTEMQLANCEYLLKTIDLVNGGTTSYGTSQYTTQQVIDDVATNEALKLIDLIVYTYTYIALSYYGRNILALKAPAPILLTVLTGPQGACRTETGGQ